MKIKDFEDMLISISSHNVKVDSIYLEMNDEQFKETKAEFYGVGKLYPVIHTDESKPLSDNLFTVKIGATTFVIQKKLYE